jgi:hypothetical protein
MIPCCVHGSAKSPNFTSKEFTKKTVLENLLLAVNRDKIRIQDPFDLIKAIFNIVMRFDSMTLDEKKNIMLETLEAIVVGKDGVLFTQDDLLPRNVIEGLQILIKSNLLFSVLDLLYELSQAQSVSSLVTRLISSVFGRLFWRRDVKMLEETKMDTQK